MKPHYLALRTPNKEFFRFVQKEVFKMKYVWGDGTVKVKLDLRQTMFFNVANKEILYGDLPIESESLFSSTKVIQFADIYKLL